jgi:hypothetical protein
MFLSSRLATIVVALSLSASAAAAQSEEHRDWDLSREDGTVLAFTTFDSGLSLGFRCKDGAFSAVAAGLPPTPDARRRLRLAIGDEEPRTSMWTSTTNSTVAVADYPAPLARVFRRGGPLRLTAPGGAPDGRDLTYAVELPPSNEAIDAALTECGRPLEDPRDALLEKMDDGGLPAGITWTRRPRIRFPDGFYASGFAVLTCLAWADGKLTDCLIESEHPHDGRFGEAALRGARSARVAFDGEQPRQPRRVGFHVAFRLSL